MCCLADLLAKGRNKPKLPIESPSNDGVPIKSQIIKQLHAGRREPTFLPLCKFLVLTVEIEG